MSETTFIGKVAQAVEDQFDDNFVELLDPEGPLSGYGLSHAIARAVLEAIREPSEAMMKAVDGCSYSCASAALMLDDQNIDPSPVALSMWQAMIDAALNEQ